MKFKLTFSLLCLIISFSFLSAEENWLSYRQKTESMGEIETIFLDNRYIQSYKNQVGIWKSSRNFSYYAKKYGVTVDNIKLVNGIPLKKKYYSTSSYIFYPFSTAYIRKLDAIGINRQKWNVARAEFIWPIRGNRITSKLGRRWGKNHSGLDIASSRGTIVVAAKDGRVMYAGKTGAFGISVTINHGDSIATKYAHLSSIVVKKGDNIKKGQIIAYSGNTGRSTGPHLHFEVRCMGIVLNPENFLPEFKESMESAIEFTSILKDKKAAFKKL